MISLLIFCTYSAGLLAYSIPGAFGVVTTIRFSHTHEVASHHDNDEDHHHAHEQSEEHHADHEDENTSADVEHTEPHHSEHHHTHEILITGNAFCPLFSKFPEISYPSFECAFPDIRDQQPPREPSLSSIFRPPIA